MNVLTITKQLLFGPAAGEFILARNKSGGSVAAGSPVIIDTSTTTATETTFTTTTSQDDKKVLGMVLETIANGAVGKVQRFGLTALLKVNGTTDIAVGDYLSTYTSAGIAAKATAGKGGVFAIALEAYTNNDSNGVIDAWLIGGAPRVDTDTSGVTLDTAYNGGVAVTVDAGAVALSNTAADNNGVLSLTKNPVGAQSGSALTIVMGAQATAAAISITNTGSGNDISGTTAVWYITKTGAAVLATLSTTAHTLLEGAAPAGTLCYIVRDNDGDVYVNAITGKVVTLRINGTDVITAAGAAITLAQATTISTGGLTIGAGGATITGNVGITGNVTITGNLTLTGAWTFGGQVTASAGIDMNGTELILDVNGDTSITADTNDQIDFKLNGTDYVSFTTTKVDINGLELVLDADADTSITADTDDQIDFKINNADDFQMTANTFTVLSGSTLTIASGGFLSATGNITVVNDTLLGLGTGNIARFSFDTTDANANELLLQLPAGGGTNVPVVVIGEAIESVDLGATGVTFNGVVNPTLALMASGAVATASALRSYKARGTIAAPTVVTTGDDLFSIDVFGAVANNEYVQAARILFEMTGTIATTRGPGVMTFQTATDAAPSVLTTAMTISAAQLVTCAAGLTVNGVVTTLSLAGNALDVLNTTDGASVQVAIFEGDRATPADNDAAYITLKLSDSAGNQDEQARISWQATTVLNGATQDGDLFFSALVNNTLTEFLRLDGSNSWVTVSNADVQVANGQGIVVGHTAQIAVGNVTSEVEVHGTAPADSTAALTQWSADAVGPVIYLAKSRNAAIGTFAIITTGDALGAIEAFGDDGVDFNSNSNASAAIRFFSSGTIAADRVPGEIRLLTATNAAPSVLTEAVRINSAGVVIVGSGEAGVTAATGRTVRAPDVATGGAGNVNGANLTIVAGLGTGTGTRGTIIFQTPQVAAAGDNIQTLETLLTLQEDSAVLKGGAVFQSAAATEIGISVANAALTVGTQGSIVAPYRSSTAASFDDTAGGDNNGCFGFQYDTDAGPTATFEARINGAWLSVALTGLEIQGRTFGGSRKRGEVWHDNQLLGNDMVDETVCVLCGKQMKVGEALVLVANYERKTPDGARNLHAVFGHMACARV